MAFNLLSAQSPRLCAAGSSHGGGAERQLGRSESCRGCRTAQPRVVALVNASASPCRVTAACVRRPLSSGAPHGGGAGHQATAGRLGSRGGRRRGAKAYTTTVANARARLRLGLSLERSAPEAPLARLCPRSGVRSPRPCSRAGARRRLSFSWPAARVGGDGVLRRRGPEPFAAPPVQRGASVVPLPTKRCSNKHRHSRAPKH